MRYYETLYLLNPSLANEEYAEIVGKFNGIVEKGGGEVIRVDEWGKKTLAYVVKRFDKGYYVLLQYCGDPGITQEFHRELKLDDRVLKYQTVKLSDSADLEALRAKYGEPKPETPKPAATPEPAEAVEPTEAAKKTEAVEPDETVESAEADSPAEAAQETVSPEQNDGGKDQEVDDAKQ